MALVFESGLLVYSESDAVIEQLEMIFQVWDTLCTKYGCRSQSGVAYTVYTRNGSYWDAIDAVRRAWWGESKPTSTSLVTNRLPDGRNWGKDKIAMEAVGVTGECEKREIYLDSPSNVSTYCHAKVVEDKTSKRVFFSGVVALGSCWKDQPGGEVDMWVISRDIDVQVHYCLRNIEGLCRKAEVTKQGVKKMDIFHDRSLDTAKTATIVAQVRESYPNADLFLRPVDGFRDFKTPILVEIRPHAVVWK